MIRLGLRNTRKTERKQTLIVAGTCGHVIACGLLGWCTRVFLSTWVHACFYCAIYKECWTLISFCDICVSACHCIRCYSRDLTCERGSVGQSEGLLIPRLLVRFRLIPENSNSHGFELHRPSIKGTKLLLKVIKAIIITSLFLLPIPSHTTL